jgi:hypothetical protein
VSNIEGKRPSSLLGVADHNQRLTVSDCESEFIPDIWVISCDFRDAGIATANALFDGLDQDACGGITVNAIDFKACIDERRNNYILAPFIVRAFIKRLDHKTASQEFFLDFGVCFSRRRFPARLTHLTRL